MFISPSDQEIWVTLQKDAQGSLSLTVTCDSLILYANHRIEPARYGSQTFILKLPEVAPKLAGSPPSDPSRWHKSTVVEISERDASESESP